MTNYQSDFGITKTDLMRYINPSYNINCFTIQDIESGTSGVAGTNTYTVSTASWRKNIWTNWELKVGSSYYTITSNTNTVITITGTPSGTTWSITKQEFDISTSDFNTYLYQAVQCVLGDIPERYRKMIYEIDGEIIVERARSGQTTASLFYPTTNDNSLQIFVNPIDWKNRRLSDKYNITTNFTIATNQNITFVNPLIEDSKVICWYEHELATVPTLLKQLGIYRLIINLSPWAYNLYDKESINFKNIKNEYNSIIKSLHDKTIGISEFDKIKLIEETREDTVSLIKSHEILM